MPRFFRDNARQAMEFYKSALGGELTISTFKDYNAAADPGEANNVMHSELKAGNGIVFMASDTPRHVPYNPGTNISMSLNGDNEAELTGYFNKLSAGGKIGQPLTKAPWGDTFGMFTDKFGINWLVNISATKA